MGTLAAPVAAAAAPPAGSTTGDGTVRVIVQTAPGVDPGQVAAATTGKKAGKAGHVYKNAVKGFSAEVSLSDVAKLKKNPKVVSVEIDGRVSVAETETPTPSWGLDRVDQRDLPLDNGYTYGTTGAGVTAYVVDTGVNLAHTEFTGRIGSGFSAIGGTANDCNGHGTHVAGTIAGTSYGIAKAATVVPVRVLDCEGSGWWSDVIAGIDWAVSHHTGGPAVLNMSLSGGGSSSVGRARQAR
jgi:subtilisin family serine protease